MLEQVLAAMPSQSSAVYGFKVRTRNQGRTWEAHVRHEGKNVWLGCQHPSELEAAEAISRCALFH